jgi:hypothetical protein
MRRAYLMKMGRERAILRWDIRRSLLEQRIARAEQQRAALGLPTGPRERERVARLTAELEDLRRQLQRIGPSPHAKMG